jgi:hypothetical protein
LRCARGVVGFKESRINSVTVPEKGAVTRGLVIAGDFSVIGDARRVFTVATNA